MNDEQRKGATTSADEPAESVQRDIVHLAKGGALKFAGSIGTTGSGFVVGVILTRFLDAANFGLFRLAYVFAEVVARVSILGLHSSTLRFVPIAARAGDHARLWGILQLTCGVPALIGMGTGAATFLLADTIALQGFEQPELAPVLRLMSAAIPLMVIVASGEAVTRAFHQIAYSVYGVDIVLPISKLLLTLALLFAGLGLTGAALAHVLAEAIAAAVIIGLVHKLFSLVRSLRAAVYPIREIVSHSFPIFFTRLLSLFAGRLETFALAYFHVMEVVGVFSIALSLSRLSELFAGALNRVSLPLISDSYAQGGTDRILPIFRSGTRWSVIATLPTFLVVVIFAEHLLAIFGEEFRAGKTALLILSLGPLIQSSSWLASGIITMTGNARLNTLNAALSMAVTVILDLTLIPRFGITGAAMAAAGTISFLSLLRLSEVFWLFRMQPYTVELLKPLAAGAAAAAVALALDHGLPIEQLQIRGALGIAALVSTYVAVLWFLGASDDDEPILELLRERLPFLRAGR